MKKIMLLVLLLFMLSLSISAEEATVIVLPESGELTSVIEVILEGVYVEYFAGALALIPTVTMLLTLAASYLANAIGLSVPNKLLHMGVGFVLSLFVIYLGGVLKLDLNSIESFAVSILPLATFFFGQDLISAFMYEASREYGNPLFPDKEQ